MRVSTAQIFDFGAKGIGRNQFDLFKLQNQLSTGRRVLTPEDDPIAASQALVVEQSKRVSQQFLDNQGDAKGKLSLLEGNLVGLGDLLQNVRERVVQAGNTTLTNADRNYIAQELEARFSELMGIANAQDGAGNYLFSGYQGAVKPFSADATGAQYAGDNGERLLQVEASRQLPTNVSGSELFQQVRNGNGTFATATGGNTLGGINKGSGIIDVGSVNDQAAWRQALADPTLLKANPAPAPPSLEIDIRFVEVSGVTMVELYRPDNTRISGPTTFVSGQSIPLMNGAVSLGASVVIDGIPKVGDTFTISQSANQSIFETLRSTIDMLKSGIGSVAGGNSSTEFANRLAGNLQNIDQSLENVSGVRARVGSYLKELDSLTSTGEDLQLQYASSLSALQDLDYAKAITDLSKKQLQLEAAQISFKQISQLSLFNIL